VPRRGTIVRVKLVIDALAACGGLATTAELAARGVERQQLDIAVMYSRVVRVRKGLWATLDLAPAALPALRAGGRLACVSALVFLGEIEDAGFPLHLAAPLGVTSWHPRRHRGAVVRHWSRRALPGDRLAVSAETAWAQFALCRAVAGRDVRLRRTDSL
jgi:hypothetical protein